jgi:probable rRNA maturation factor
MTKDKALSLSFSVVEEIKNEILGKDYELSIVYVNEKLSRKLNFEYRGKDNSTNILSFNVSPNTGELVICQKVLKKQAKDFDKTPTQFLGFLVIHGMLHLKGLEHGSIMERKEQKYDEKYFSSYRHRIGKNPGSSRGMAKG